MKREGLRSLLVIGLGLALGLWLAGQINGFLGITYLPKDLPSEPRLMARPVSSPPPSLEPIAAVVLPEGALDHDLYAYSVAALADALEERTGSRPQVLGPSAALPQGPVIVVGSGEGPSPDDPQGFSLTPAEWNGRPALLLEAASPLGHAFGLYHLADLVHTGADQDTLFTARRRTPAFSHRLVDLGAVGVPQDPERWDPTNYRHSLGAFQDAYLPDPPYVDAELMRRYEADFRDYVHRMIAYGNNGLVFGGFLEFVDFDKVGDGYEIYPAGSPYRARQAAMREHLGRLICYAHDMGMEVILRTDMVALTPPLRAYFDRRFGGMDTENPEFWEVYRLGLEELFEEMPCVDGLMIRIGEAGAIYNLPGWDYTSALEVRSVEAVQAMLRAFLQVAEAYGKWIVFRSWSVGIGEVGDMHIDVEAYDRILGEISSPRLLVSTKYVMGDYYSYLPFNPTLVHGDEGRLVEMQNRLEFEGFMAFPDYIAPLHQEALEAFREAGADIRGLWQWNQGGGPQQAGPMSLYPFYGFWLWIDANAYVTAQLAWEPDADVVALTEMWVRRTFGNDPQTVRNLTELLLRSREPVLDGLYIRPFARQRVRALGLETTPMMWIFEWDIVDGSNSVLSVMYHVSRDDLDAAIDEGFRAVETVRQMKALVEDLDPSAWRRPDLYPKVLASLEYEENLFETLAWYRRAFLRYYQWLDTGSRVAFADWQAARDRFQALRADHLARYGSDRDFPAYNFYSADAGMAHAVRGPAMAWLARLALLATAVLLLVGSPWVAGWLPSSPAMDGLRALWAGWTRPGRLAGLPMDPGRALVALGLPVLLLLLDHLVVSSFRSPHYIGLVGALMGTFAAVSMLLGRRGGVGRVGSAVLASLVLWSAVPLVPVAVRGPLYLWYRLWTDAAFRVGLVAANVVIGLWALWNIYRAQRHLVGRSRISAVGSVVLAIGGALIVAGAVPAGIGLEQAITGLNDEMAVLPLGLSLILGIVTHLDIPANLPWMMMGGGGGLALAGGLFMLPEAFRRWRGSARDKQTAPAREGRAG